jgi:uncharacterized protein (TIGR03083 family)
MFNVDDFGVRFRDLVDARSDSVVAALGELDEAELAAASALPQWTRLTIACHLRFGAETLARMTRDALAGLPTAYYPEGRSTQRPRTLVPSAGESPRHVVEGLARACRELGDQWLDLTDDHWRLSVMEPTNNPDLGPSTLARLALGRLTELEVHGTDLNLNLSDWDEDFVAVALPARLEGLNTRRSNHRDFDKTIRGSWRLTATDGPTYLVSLSDDGVSSSPAPPDSTARATITGSSRDLLSLLLGRPTVDALRISGDREFAQRFEAAFPGP